LTLIFWVNISYAQNSRDTLHTKIGFAITLNSRHLNDSVKPFIHHPFNYKPDKEFPLILLLDANSSFKAFSSCSELMAYDRSIPTCIAVGFPQYQYANFTSENLEEKMDQLAKFIERELLPYLKSQYKITKTIVWGQGSGSGLISSYMMLEYPELFNGYISDVPDLSLIQDKVHSKNAFTKLQDKELDYYLFGSKSNDVYNKAFLNNLKTNAPEGLDWNYGISDESNEIIYFLTNYMHAIDLFLNDTTNICGNNR